MMLCYRCRAWVRKAAEAGKLDTILTWHAPPDYEETSSEGLESLVEGHSGEGRHATEHGKEAARTGDKVGHCWRGYSDESERLCVASYEKQLVAGCTVVFDSHMMNCC